MGDPWKSITPKGVQAFVNATIATLVVWLTVENHLAIIVNYLSSILSSQTAGLSAYFLVLALVLYKLLYKRSSYDVNEKRATKYAILTMLLIWVTWEGYLQFIIPIRSFQLPDLIANMLGVLVALCFIKIYLFFNR